MADVYKQTELEIPNLHKALNVSSNFMSTPFSDITVYSPTIYKVGTPEYIEETSLKNYVSDLYVQYMEGYKPPMATRITIQPAYYGIWNRTWKIGSIFAIAPFFSLETYLGLDKKGKLKYILDLIQSGTIPLSNEYGWDNSVFEKAYQKVLRCNFIFRIESISKQSRDKKKFGKLIIEKTETMTSMYVNIKDEVEEVTRKIFDKNNEWWYDCVYILIRFSRWFDNDTFGINFKNGTIKILYSIENNKIELFENNLKVDKIDFGKYFNFN